MTLSQLHNYKILQDTLDAVRNVVSLFLTLGHFLAIAYIAQYVATELAEELGLEDNAYPKEFADWIDIQIAIHYTFTLDLYRYR